MSRFGSIAHPILPRPQRGRMSAPALRRATNPVAASRQSAANHPPANQRRSPKPPLRDGSMRPVAADVSPRTLLRRQNISADSRRRLQPANQRRSTESPLRDGSMRPVAADVSPRTLLRRQNISADSRRRLQPANQRRSAEPPPPAALAECHSAIQPIDNRRYAAAAGVARTGSPLFRRLATGLVLGAHGPAGWRQKLPRYAILSSFPFPLLLVALLGISAGAFASDFASLCADRTAIERVYYTHRLGTKPPFEQTMPAATVERLVRDELHKESVLRRVYGVAITPPQIEAEVRRMDGATRAPDVLAELKAALGRDPARFAATVARPALVQRELYQRFQNDANIHSPRRAEAERLRQQLLAVTNSPHASVTNLAEARVAVAKASGSNEVFESTWRLGQRPAGAVSPEDERPGRGYFEDLPADLQRVLRLQLRGPGDVSAVIETGTSFQVFICRSRTAEELSVAVRSLPKRSYEEWLSKQTEN